jgi:hypothetical protein
LLAPDRDLILEIAQHSGLLLDARDEDALRPRLRRRDQQVGVGGDDGRVGPELSSV